MKLRILCGILSLAWILSLFGCAFRPLTPSEPTADPQPPEESVLPAAATGTPPVTTVPPETAEPPQTEPAPVYEEACVSFLGAGDDIIYYGNVRDAASCAVPGGRTYNFAPMFDQVAPLIAAADVAFINQETLMSGGAFSYYPMFNGPQDLGYDLAEVGFDVVNIANNHMLDKGESGLAATIDFWRTVEGVTLIGGYKSQEEYDALCVLEANGIRIAFLSYAFMTNGLALPASSPLVVPYPNREAVPGQLSRAREAADFVIVSVHWGDENVFTPNEEQTSFAELLAENGADVILGHHPHVLQPIEWLERPDGAKTLCVYSLGNFAAEMARDYNMLGGMITFDIVRRSDGSIQTENVRFLPTVYYFTTTFYQNRIYLLTDFTDALAASHGLAYYGRSLSLAALHKYLKQTISSEFLPDSLH